MNEVMALLETLTTKALVYVAASLSIILGWVTIYAIKLGSKLVIKWRDSISQNISEFSEQQKLLKTEYENTFVLLKRDLYGIIERVNRDKSEYIVANAEVRAATLGLKSECIKIEKMLQATLLTLEAKVGSVIEMKDSFEETRRRVISVENFIKVASEKLRKKE